MTSNKYRNEFLIETGWGNLRVAFSQKMALGSPRVLARLFTHTAEEWTVAQHRGQLEDPNTLRTPKTKRGVQRKEIVVLDYVLSGVALATSEVRVWHDWHDIAPHVCARVINKNGHSSTYTTEGRNGVLATLARQLPEVLSAWVLAHPLEMREFRLSNAAAALVALRADVSAKEAELGRLRAVLEESEAKFIELESHHLANQK